MNTKKLIAYTKSLMTTHADAIQTLYKKCPKLKSQLHNLTFQVLEKELTHELSERMIGFCLHDADKEAHPVFCVVEGFNRYAETPQEKPFDDYLIHSPDYFSSEKTFTTLEKAPHSSPTMKTFLKNPKGCTFLIEKHFYRGVTECSHYNLGFDVVEVTDYQNQGRIIKCYDNNEEIICINSNRGSLIKNISPALEISFSLFDSTVFSKDDSDDQDFRETEVGYFSFTLKQAHSFSIDAYVPNQHNTPFSITQRQFFDIKTLELKRNGTTICTKIDMKGFSMSELNLNYFRQKGILEFLDLSDHFGKLSDNPTKVTFSNLKASNLIRSTLSWEKATGTERRHYRNGQPLNNW